jgi:hypothetical protein
MICDSAEKPSVHPSRPSGRTEERLNSLEIFLPGPWLEPGFREKGFEKMTERIRLIKQLIDRFNSMLKEIAGMSEFPHVRYIDLRSTLSIGANYKTFWANELHPTEKGFELVSDRFAAALEKLPA